MKVFKWIVCSILIFIGAFVFFAIVGQKNGGSIATDRCDQSAEAAHYIAAKSVTSGDVARVTGDVIADRRYPDLEDKVIASIGAVVVLSKGTMSPDEIAASLRMKCLNSISRQGN